MKRLSSLVIFSLFCPAVWREHYDYTMKLNGAVPDSGHETLAIGGRFLV